jgi:hypothetical protein
LGFLVSATKLDDTVQMIKDEEAGESKKKSGEKEKNHIYT